MRGYFQTVLKRQEAHVPVTFYTNKHTVVRDRLPLKKRGYQPVKMFIQLATGSTQYLFRKNTAISTISCHCRRFYFVTLTTLQSLVLYLFKL